MCKLFYFYVQLILGALSADPLSVGHLRASGVGRQGLSRYTWSWRDHQGSQIDKNWNWKIKFITGVFWAKQPDGQVRPKKRWKNIEQKLPKQKATFEQLNLRKVHGCLPSLQGRCCAKGKALSDVNASKYEEKNFKLTFERCEYSLCRRHVSMDPYYHESFKNEILTWCWTW